MTWDASQDDPRRGFGKPGGDWEGVRPSFDNPFTWSVPLGRVFGISVRVHLLLLIFIVVELGRAISIDQSEGTSLGLMLTATMLGGLFIVVLLHEFGHCIACRMTGGAADEILMWPLGGLAFCQPPNTWRAHLVTVIGGPAVNVIICLVLGTTLGLLTGRWLGVALPNPLSLGVLYSADLTSNWWITALFLVNWVSLLLFLFNLIPMFPLDGGRVLQSLLWSKMGYTRSMRIAVRVGYVGAVLLVIFGWIMEEFTLIGIAIFGGIVCYLTHKQLEYTDEMLGFETDDAATWLADSLKDDAPSPRDQKRAAKEAEAQRKHAEEVDRILDKIRTSGMKSLTLREKRILKKESKRKRESS